MYERADGAVQIVFASRFGWYTWNFQDRSLSGHAWDVPVEEQGDCPPERVWVSLKGIKSYVYELRYASFILSVDGGS